MTFEEYIETRCEQALLANCEFREIQMKSDDAYKKNDIEKYNEYAMQMLVIAESVCYKRAIKDIHTLLSED